MDFFLISVYSSEVIDILKHIGLLYHEKCFIHYGKLILSLRIVRCSERPRIFLENLPTIIEFFQYKFIIKSNATC